MREKVSKIDVDHSGGIEACDCLPLRINKITPKFPHAEIFHRLMLGINDSFDIWIIEK